MVTFLCWLKEKYSLNIKIILLLRDKSKAINCIFSNYLDRGFIEIFECDLMGYRGIKEINKIEEKFDMVIHAASPSSGIAYNRNKEGTIFINSIVI